jgi:hypothetical protein
MLYELKMENENYTKIEPVGFNDFSDFGKTEKYLENLISENQFSTLFEDGSLMPIFQERQWQPEADIYALNSKGELLIFELKTSTAGENALHQILRYAQDANNWTYSTLETKFQHYEKTTDSLKESHQKAFDLVEPLLEREFNQKQKLLIIGNAADDNLISAIDYWKSNGINIDFIPYRLYKLGNKVYFEMFSKPYDRHINPAKSKGVLFDTNMTYDSNALWEMFNNDMVAAYGDAKKVIYHLNKQDIVFLSHRGAGIVGACIIDGEVIRKDDNTWYRKATYLTEKFPDSESLKAMPFWKVKEILGKNFYWAKTIKVPYLSYIEAKTLLTELKEFFKR